MGELNKVDRMILYSIASSEQDLKSILHLQKLNLPKNISIEEAQKEGFVTIHHDFDLLKKMNSPFPHIIAKSNQQVIAYALVMLRKWEDKIPILVPMFNEINKFEYANELLGNSSYFIMGQICIAKEYRGKNVFQGLYQEMKNRMKDDFKYIITEVSTRNQRSMKAHVKVGFKNIKIYQADNGESWAILLLEMV